MNKVGLGIALSSIILLSGATLGGFAYLTDGFKNNNIFENIDINSPELEAKYQTNNVSSIDDIRLNNVYSLDMDSLITNHNFFDEDPSIEFVIPLSMYHSEKITLNALPNEMICFFCWIYSDIDYCYEVEVIGPDYERQIFYLDFTEEDLEEPLIENDDFFNVFGSKGKIDVVPCEYIFEINPSVVFDLSPFWSYFSSSSYNQYVARK